MHEPCEGLILHPSSTPALCPVLPGMGCGPPSDLANGWLEEKNKNITFKTSVGSLHTTPSPLTDWFMDLEMCPINCRFEISDQMPIALI